MTHRFHNQQEFESELPASVPCEPSPWLVKRHIAARSDDWLAGRGCDPVLLLTAGLMVFAALTLFLTAGYHAAFMTLHDSGRALFNPVVWANITFLGDTAAALAIATLFAVRFPHLVQATLVSALVCTVLIHTAKAGFNSLRPPAVLSPEILDVIGPAYRRHGFPSGHTATAFVMAGLLTRAVRGWYNRLAVLLGAVFIGWSRVAVGVHWPVDVLAGAGIGLVSAFIGLRLTDRVRLRSAVYMSISGVLLASCGYLFFHHGGFAATRITAPLLGAVAIAQWGVCWLVLNIRDRHERDLAPVYLEES